MKRASVERASVFTRVQSKLARAWRTAPATVAVSTLCVAVFMALGVAGEPEGWSEWERWGVATIDSVHAGQVWVLWTSCLVHVDLWHIVFNVWSLWIIGRALERALGTWRYVALSLVCAAISSAAQLAASDATGIGYSGVLYGLIGFGWFLRKRSAELASVFTRGDSILWVAWLFGCLLLTRFKIVSIGNAAHFAGLASGALLGWSFTRPRLRMLFASTSISLLVLLITVANVRRPWSPNWCSDRAWSAHKHGDMDAAQRWYLQSLDLGEDPLWCRARLARVALVRGDAASYEAHLAGLRVASPERAREIEIYATGRAGYLDQLSGKLGSSQRRLRQAQLDLHDWKLDVAREGFEALARSGFPRPELTLGLADCCEFDPESEASDLRSALDQLRAESALQPSSDPRRFDVEARLLRRLGDADAAIAIEKRAQELFPARDR